MISVDAPNVTVHRVKWIRDMAARDRCREEIEILCEEYKRGYGWHSRTTKIWHNIATETMVSQSEGSRAYAYEQSEHHERLAETYPSTWKAEIQKAAKQLKTLRNEHKAGSGPLYW